MIIERIRLQNVYSHEDTDLVLGENPYAVVKGHNGAGKSTLFVDGPLFALYGSRAVRGDTLSDIVRSGALTATATVVFTFGGERYRVTRTYSVRTKSGSHDLEFLREESPGEWSPVTTGSVPEIDASIQELIGADYVSFTLGSIMRQGESARFTDATPGQRVDALAQLLGVEYLGKVYTEAGARMRTAAEKIEMLDKEIERLRETVKAAQELSKKIDEAKGRLNSIEPPDLTRRDQAVEERTRLKGEELELVPKSEKESAITWDIETATTFLKRSQEDAKRAQEKIARLEAQRKEIAEECEKPKVSAEELTERLKELRKATEKRVALTARISAGQEKIHEVEIELERLERDLPEFFPGSQVWDLYDSRTEMIEEQLRLQVRPRLKAAEMSWQEYKDDRPVIKGLWDRHIEAESHLLSLSKKVDRLRKRVAPINQRPDGVTDEICQPCGLLQDAWSARQELEGMPKIIIKAELTRDKALDKFAAMAASWGVASLEEYRELSEGLQRARIAAQEEVRKYERQIEESEKVASRCDAVGRYRAVINGLRKELEELPPAEEAASTIADIEEKIARHQICGVNERQLATIREDLERENEHLEEIEQLIEEKTRGIEAAKVQLETVKGSGEKLKLTRHRITELEKELALIAEANDKASRERAEIEKELAMLQGRAEGVADSKKRLSEAEKDREKARDDEQILGYCRRLFKQAPQIVVAGAVELIEIHANEILEDVAPTFRVEVDQQRETKSGTTRDEINIRVMIGGQHRPYDALSGGERFRVDIALRLAMARAVTGRADNRSLDTLIVDEGWGCLDAEGVASLKDTFIRLRKRFQSIYVISHVDLSGLFEAEIQLNNGNIKVIQ